MFNFSSMAKEGGDSERLCGFFSSPRRKARFLVAAGKGCSRIKVRTRRDPLSDIYIWRPWPHRGQGRTPPPPALIEKSNMETYFSSSNPTRRNG
jgi:hypothetical protein